MNKYQVRSYVFAEQFDGSYEQIQEYGLITLGFEPSGKPILALETLEGDMKIKVGDWIATGVNGEHWAIADDIFKKTYVEVEE